MRVPTMSEGTRSGVNWMREKEPPTTVASPSESSFPRVLSAIALPFSSGRLACRPARPMAPQRTENCGKAGVGADGDVKRHLTPHRVVSRLPGRDEPPRHARLRARPPAGHADRRARAERLQ